MAKNKQPAKLDKVLSPRKANRAGERLKAFQDKDEHFVSATTVIDSDGKILKLQEDTGIQGLILDELRRIRLILTLETGNDV